MALEWLLGTKAKEEGRKESLREMLKELGPNGVPPEENYAKYAAAEGREAFNEMGAFVDEAPKELEHICLEASALLAKRLTGGIPFSELSNAAGEVTTEYKPIGKLLQAVGATHEDVYTAQVRDMLPKAVERLADSWNALGFASRDEALVSLGRERQAIRMMESEKIVAELAARGINTSIGEFNPPPASELKKAHMPQSMEGDNIAQRRANASFVGIIGMMFTDRIVDVHHTALEHVKRSRETGSHEEDDSFLSLSELLKRRYQEGVARAGSSQPARVGLMNVAFEIGRQLRSLQDSLRH